MLQNRSHTVVATSFLLLLVLIAALRLHQSDWTASSFVVAGETYVSSLEELGPLRPVLGGGYDGQFNTRLAMDPFTKEATKFGMTIDRPAYRHQRMLYPILGWVASFGNKLLTPYVLIMINLVAFIAILILSRRLFLLIGAENHLFLIIALIPGLLMSFGRNLGEPLSIALILSGLVLMHKGRIWHASVMLALACLSRETLILWIVGIILWKALQAIKEHQKISRFFRESLPFFLATLPMLLWQIFLFKTWGQFGPQASPPNFVALPLAGIISQLYVWSLDVSSFGKSAAQLFYLGWFLSLGSLTLFAMRKNRIHVCLTNDVGYLYVVGAILTLFMSWYSMLIWEDAWAFARVLADWALCMILILVIHTQKISKAFWLYTSAIFAFTSIRLAMRV